MDENFFLLSSLVLLGVILYLLDFWNTRPSDPAPDSETHARTRYSMAEKIQKEFEERKPPFNSTNS